MAKRPRKFGWEGVEGDYYWGERVWLFGERWIKVGE